MNHYTRRTALLTTKLTVAAALVLGGIASAARPEHKLTASAPIRCSGNTELTLSGRLIQTAGTGVHVGGNCTLILRGSHVDAGARALEVSGNGTIRLEDSTVAGRRAALQIGDNGTVQARRSRIFGAVRTAGNGELENLGGNQRGRWSARPAVGKRQPPLPARLRPLGLRRSKPIRCSGNRTMAVSRLHVTGGETGIVASGNCRLVVKNSWIHTTTVGLEASGNATVELQDCYIMGTKAALSASGNATVKGKRTQLEGQVARNGNGTVDVRPGKPRIRTVAMKRATPVVVKKASRAVRNSASASRPGKARAAKAHVQARDSSVHVGTKGKVRIRAPGARVDVDENGNVRVNGGGARVEVAK